MSFGNLDSGFMWFGEVGRLIRMRVGNVESGLRKSGLIVRV